MNNEKNIHSGLFKPKIIGVSSESSIHLPANLTHGSQSLSLLEVAGLAGQAWLMFVFAVFCVGAATHQSLALNLGPQETHQKLTAQPKSLLSQFNLILFSTFSSHSSMALVNTVVHKAAFATSDE